MLETTEAYGLNFLFPAGDTAIGRSLAEHGEFARVVSDFLIEHSFAPSGAMIDAGANIGAVCLPFAAARPRWRIYAVEASRPVAAILAANAFNNRLTNVEVVQAAAGRTTGVIDFPAIQLAEHGNWGTLSMTRKGEDTAKTLCVALDDLAPIDTWTVKIDTEGMDAQVLEGSRRLIEKTRPLWVVEADRLYPGVAEPVIETLLQADYDLYWLYAPFASARPARGSTPKNMYTGDTNVVALAKGAANRWNLPRVTCPTQERPDSVAHYPYLERYGFRP